MPYPRFPAFTLYLDMKLCPQCTSGYHDSHTTCPTHGGVLNEVRELKPGLMIHKTYRIVRKLGRGGMGTVYLADHVFMQEQRALKFLSAELCEDENFTGRFRREVATLRRIRHKNVVDCGDLEPAEDDSLFFSMEFVDGPDLREFLRRSQRPLEIPWALEVTRGVAEGLAAAHALGMVHRDIKPENILMARAGDGWQPKIADFGIVATRETTGSRTRTGGTLLTMQYAAPEQWRGMRSAELDGRTDFYALGGVLYEMLTGQTPFSGESYEEWAELHRSAYPKAPSELRPELARWNGLDLLIWRMLAKDRNQRPANAAEVLAALDAIQKPGRMPEPPTAPAQRRPAVEPPPFRQPAVETPPAFHSGGRTPEPFVPREPMRAPDPVKIEPARHSEPPPFALNPSVRGASIPASGAGPVSGGSSHPGPGAFQTPGAGPPPWHSAGQMAEFANAARTPGLETSAGFLGGKLPLISRLGFAASLTIFGALRVLLSIRQSDRVSAVLTAVLALASALYGVVLLARPKLRAMAPWLSAGSLLTIAVAMALLALSSIAFFFPRGLIYQLVWILNSGMGSFCIAAAAVTLAIPEVSAVARLRWALPAGRLAFLVALALLSLNSILQLWPISGNMALKLLSALLGVAGIALVVCVLAKLQRTIALFLLAGLRVVGVPLILIAGATATRRFPLFLGIIPAFQIALAAGVLTLAEPMDGAAKAGGDSGVGRG